MDDEKWRQASLPVRWGGLGVRGVVLLAPSAYLASAANTTDLTSALLPARLRAVEDSGIDAALAAWTRQATNPFDVSTLSVTPPDSTAQRVWDDHFCKVQYDELLNAASDSVDRARLLASCSAGSGDWLHAVPLSSVGLNMDNSTVRISAGLRLEHQLFVFASASVELRLQLMVIMVSPVVMVLVVIQDITKLTTCYVVHSSAREL